MTRPGRVAVVGAGFGGSLIALIAARLGHEVLLVERGTLPRFAIGESSTPMANFLERLHQAEAADADGIHAPLRPIDPIGVCDPRVPNRIPYA